MVAGVDFGQVISIQGLGIGSGWALVCMGVIMIFRGTLITKREADAQRRQIDALTETLATKDKTIADFKDATVTSNSLISAVLDVARERS